EPAERSAEQQLRWGADVAGTRLLEAALRAAEAGAGTIGLPRLPWAEASGAEVVLVLDQPAPPPPGVLATDPRPRATTATAERSAEKQLRWGADVAGARLLNAALRAAAAGARATGLPRLAWAEAGGAEVVLVLDQPAPPPPGFLAADPDRWVTTATAESLAAAGATAAAPLPALVPLGATDEGTEL